MRRPFYLGTPGAGYGGFGIHGEVYLWGAVVEHELDWRAQYACPKNIFLPLEMLPVGMRMLEPRLNTLAAYGCDIHLIGREGNMPLWTRRLGRRKSVLRSSGMRLCRTKKAGR